MRVCTDETFPLATLNDMNKAHETKTEVKALRRTWAITAPTDRCFPTSQQLFCLRLCDGAKGNTRWQQEMQCAPLFYEILVRTVEKK